QQFELPPRSNHPRLLRLRPDVAGVRAFFEAERNLVPLIREPGIHDALAEHAIQRTGEDVAGDQDGDDSDCRSGRRKWCGKRPVQWAPPRRESRTDCKRTAAAAESSVPSRRFPAPGTRRSACAEESRSSTSRTGTETAPRSCSTNARVSCAWAPRSPESVSGRPTTISLISSSATSRAMLFSVAAG